VSRTITRAPRERILKGGNGWWFLGPGGVARLVDAHLTEDRRLRPEVERRLRARGLFQVADYRTYALTVLTSTDCNLGCGYCFQNTGQDGSGGNRPPRIAHARLTPETTTSILEFAANQMSRAGIDRLAIMLFGGEPLLNLRGCRDLLARAADHGLASVSMISNGTLLTPLLARELAGLGLRSVQITFDGERRRHDGIRVRRSGGGTFDTIVRNIAAASDSTPIRWALRINVSHHNHTGIDTLVEQLGAALDPSRCSMYFARVGDIGVGYANELLHTGLLAASFGRWQRRALELGFTVPRPRANTPCQACSFPDGRYGAVVNADGVLASCWETAGKPGWEVGTTRTGYLPHTRTADRWLSCGDMYRSDEGSDVLATFQDTVDAALLDHLSHLGRL
jgi:uncharacterized protein